MMIKRSALLILICIALAHTDTASARDVVWIDVGDATLYKGGTYSYEDFTVEFVDCENKGDLERTHHEEGGDLVLLRLKKGDLVVNESVLNATCANVSSTNICDELIWDDEVKIEIYADTDDYPRSEDPINWQDSCIHIYFHERAKPEISLEIETNCETYTAQDSEISITVDIANEGDADLENLSVAIDSGDLQAIAPLDRRFGNLSVGAEETFRTRLSVPSWITETEGGTFIITVNATGFDERDAMYTESESVEILVLPRFDLKIKKTVNGYISMDQSVWVRIDLENTGKRDLEVKLNDTVPPGFRLCEHTSETRWKFNITPSEALHFSYHIKPELPGVFKMPAATAEFVMGENNISIRSNAPQITVDGAYVIVAKTIHPANVSVGSTVTVTLNVTNTGNRDAIVNLTDVLPSGASLVSGNRTLHATLAGDQTEITEYAINFSVPGNVTLNPPIISVTSRDYSCIVVSDMPVVEVTGGIMTAATPAREDNSTATTSKRSVDVPIYEILLAVCMLAVVYLVGRFR